MKGLAGLFGATGRPCRTIGRSARRSRLADALGPKCWKCCRSWKRTAALTREVGGQDDPSPAVDGSCASSTTSARRLLARHAAAITISTLACLMSPSTRSTAARKPEQKLRVSLARGFLPRDDRQRAGGHESAQAPLGNHHVSAVGEASRPDAIDSILLMASRDDLSTLSAHSGRQLVSSRSSSPPAGEP